MGKLPNGLSIQEMRVPLGVIGMIYEARPNVTVDAATICLKTGNAVILRGSSSAIHSNKAHRCRYSQSAQTNKLTSRKRTAYRRYNAK